MKIRLEPSNSGGHWFITMTLIVLCVAGACAVIGYVGLFEDPGAWEIQ